MRDRSNILNRSDHDARSLEAGNRAFAAGTRPLDLNFHFLHPELRGTFRTGFGSTLSGKRGALSASLETDGPSGSPAQHVTVRISDRHDRVVERRLDMSDSPGDVSANLTFFHFCHDETR